MDTETMQKHLKEQKILFSYTEICTEPRNVFDDNIENLLRKVQKDKFESKRQFTKNKVYNDEGMSESKCLIF